MNYFLKDELDAFEDEIPNPQLDLAFEFVQQTNRNLFLTGKAGTGKTTFLRKLKTMLPKRMIVVAPTGVAAINAGGVTIHSFFQMHFGPNLPVDERVQQHTSASGNSGHNLQRFGREKISIIRSLDLLIIDEISMVRADLLDGIDRVLRRFRNRSLPFGGVQLLMIGDLQQLAPVVKPDDRQLLSTYYDSFFFFGSRALQKTSFITIELKHIYRQSDQEFISLLNHVRDNKLDGDTLRKLNSRYVPGFSQEGYITLTTHVHQAEAINAAKLRLLPAEAVTYTGFAEGEFPESSFPADAELVLKTGAQVMFVKNDISREKMFFNGKIGQVTRLDDEAIYVKCEGDDSEIPVVQAEWINNRYTIDPETREITETPVGRFVQFPLKLAWAITIHKSQGLTFDKAIIDANAAFAHGQVYVALSRCKTFEGMVLLSPVSDSSVFTDAAVDSFSADAVKHAPGEQELSAAKAEYQRNLVFELFDFGSMAALLARCRRTVRENLPAFLPSAAEFLDSVQSPLESEIVAVGARFRAKIGQLLEEDPLVDQNQPQQERIMKASTYFIDKIETIVSNPLSGFSAETDNRALRTQLRDEVEALYREAFVKTACLKACANGFDVKAYLRARALASIEPISLKNEKQSAGKRSSETGLPDDPLFVVLRNWRNNKADELGVNRFQVLPQNTLLLLAREKPLTLRDLAKVKGFGKIRTNAIGPEILTLIRKYLDLCEPLHQEAQKEAKPKVKQKKGDSARLTLELFRSGKTVEEIAARRGLSKSTIEAQLSIFVRSGDIEAERLIPAERLLPMVRTLRKNPGKPKRELLQLLGSGYTYGELELALAYLANEAGQQFSKQESEDLSA